MTGLADTRGVLRVTRAGAVSTIWIDNPRHRNAVTKCMWGDFPRVIDEVAHDAETRVIVVRGVGGDFSTGADIGELMEILRDDSTGSYSGGLTTAAELALAGCPKPTVAAIEGYCVGGGWQLAAACDIRMASSEAVFGATPSKVGIVYPLSGLKRLVNLVGPAAAKYLLFSGNLIEVDEALALGLVSLVAPATEFEASLGAFVSTLLERSQLAMQAMKDLIDCIAEGGDGLDERSEIWQREMALSEDPSIGVQAFLNKETPVFHWTGEEFWRNQAGTEAKA